MIILVTGVGAVIGQGVIRSLRRRMPSCRIVGVDRDPNCIGKYLVDEFIAKPPTESEPDYLTFWYELLNSKRVEIIFPCIEEDVWFFSDNRDNFASLNVQLILNRTDLITSCKDKYSFSKALQALGFPVIPFLVPNSWDEALDVLGSPPFIFKPKCGSASRGVVKIAKKEDLEYWRKVWHDNWFLQKQVGSENSEYTVGVFGLNGGNFLGPIVLRRKLSSAGNTVMAEIAHSDQICNAVSELVKIFKPIGPTNFQFRLDDNFPYLLEINPRLSSSTSLKSYFGFDEVMMSIEFFHYRRIPVPPIVSLTGSAYRILEDFYVS